MKGNVLHTLGVMAFGLVLLGAGPQGPARIGVVLPGEQWHKGVPVARLPIERPEVHELILNLDTAGAIGVRFSQEALNRADDLVGKRSAR